MSNREVSEVQTFYETDSGLGKMYLGDSRDALAEMESESVDLIVTSPPFGLVREKEYGNVSADNYLDWFGTFADTFRRVLKDTGSLVVDIGGAWNKGKPTRSLYHFKLAVMLVEQYGFHLAQEFFWWNKAKLPSPAEWVTIRRIRVKDAVNMVWWFSKTPYPKASNKRVLEPYSKSQMDLFENGYKAKERPSGHDISDNFSNENEGSIPPNILVVPNTKSSGKYYRYCEENDIDVHPARFPEAIPELFIRMTTDKEDTVVDPFAGSCVTGAVAERLSRNWICIDTEEEYLRGGLGRFKGEETSEASDSESETYYEIPKTGLLWNQLPEEPLPEDGGRTR